MSGHKDQFLEVNRYIYILDGEYNLNEWNKIGRFVLYEAICSLSNTMPFTEKDTNILLLMQDMSPRLPNSLFRKCTKKALLNFFRSMINHSSS
jgi:hypothetical protein